MFNKLNEIIKSPTNKNHIFIIFGLDTFMSSFYHEKQRKLKTMIRSFSLSC